MAEPKLGKSTGNAGKGRRKGSVNKYSSTIKDMVTQALDEAGGVEYLRAQATSNPTAFLGLVGKVLPIQLNAEHSGKIVQGIEIQFGRTNNAG